MFAGLLGLFGGLFKGWFERRQRRADIKLESELKRIEAQTEIEIKRATADINWDVTMAEATKTSWKDEYLTILLTVPIIASFFPGGPEIAQRAFKAMAEAPEWYTISFGAAVAASFGIRDIVKGFSKRLFQ